MRKFFLLSLILYFFIVPLSYSQVHRDTISADNAIRILKAGNPINRFVIAGDLELWKLAPLVEVSKESLQRYPRYRVGRFITQEIRIMDSEIIGEITVVSKADIHYGSVCTVFYRRLIFSNVRIHGRVDFSDSEFENPVMFSYTHFDSEANFLNCYFSSLSFFECRFEGKVQLSEVKVDAIASFTSDEFKDKTEFFNAKFQNGVHFSSIHFEGQASFVGTEFNGESWFLGMEFGNKATFSSARFNRCFFSGVTFTKDTDLSDVTFGDTTLKGDIEIPAIQDIPTVFVLVTFEADADFIRTKFLSDIELAEAKFKKSLNFYRAEFNKDINIYFRDVNYSILNIDFDQIYKKIRKSEGPKSEPLSNIYEAFENYFQRSGELKYANMAHYMYKVNEFKEKRSFANYLEWIFFGSVSAYGTSLLRVVFYSFIVILIFLSYIFLPNQVP